MPSPWLRNLDLCMCYNDCSLVPTCELTIFSSASIGCGASARTGCSCTQLTRTTYIKVFGWGCIRLVRCSISCGIVSLFPLRQLFTMSDNSIDKEARDNYYVQTVNMDSAPAPPPQMAPYQRTYANPAPLGMLAYGTVILCSSILTLSSKSVGPPNLVLVFATFYGGISQTLVGMWEMFLGNTFSATVFTTYGGFNFSYGALFLPQIGILAAYSDSNGVPTQEYYNAIGIYLGIWCIGALRTTLPIVCTLGFTVVSLACLAGNAFTGIPQLATAGGSFGIIAAFGAYYGTMSMFWTQTTTLSFIRLPPLVTAPSNV
ncbi:hypothetical protein JVU11DRAFT_8619 [Chiua virens]|nr:hypothetical protein JVU11DRAFT_8619 [Chiua virens]